MRNVRQIAIVLKCWLAIFTCLPCGVVAADAVDFIPRLAGIVILPNLKLALLAPGPGQSETRYLLLAEGQREAEIEVVKINPTNASVRLNLFTKAAMLPLTITNLALKSGPGVCLDSATLDSVLRLYGLLANRTLLRSSLLPQVTLTLNAGVTNDAEAAHVLQSALAEKGMSIVPDGNRFLVVVPMAEASKVKPLAAQIKSSAVGGSGEETLPPGIIQFNNSSPAQVLQVYAEVVGRKVQRGEPWPSDVAPGITLVTQTKVSKEEAIYALETVLEWAGLKLVRVGEDGLKAVPAPENRR